MEGDFGLPKLTLQRLKGVLRAHPAVLRAIVYGSRAKGNYRPSSDIDLTLDAPDLAFSELLCIEQEIDDLLLPYQVDLSRLSEIDDPALREHIEHFGRVL